VELDAFRIGRWPVTVAEYAVFVDDGGYAEARWWQKGGHGEWTEPGEWNDQLQYPSRPVISISWREAAAYCAWLTERRQTTGLARSPREIVRLPSEAERELTARGLDGRRYPWGKTAPGPERLNFDGNIGAPTPVGIYPAGASPEGVLDLAGNVWEWCEDWYSDNYYRECMERGTARNPKGPEQGGYRLLRGGSWLDESWYARAAYRNLSDPVNRDSTSSGFGCCWFCARTNAFALLPFYVLAGGSPARTQPRIGSDACMGVPPNTSGPNATIECG
jgi:formylglycine-generating enzyme required for sulfatase activity